MLSTTGTHALLGLTLFLGLAAPAIAQPIDALWDASSGLFPEQVCPAWTAIDTADPENPVITSGALTLSTSTGAENMLYLQELDPPGADALTVEARVKVTSGSSSAANRAPAVIGITSAANAARSSSSAPTRSSSIRAAT